MIVSSVLIILKTFMKETCSLSIHSMPLLFIVILADRLTNPINLNKNDLYAQ